jgi:hypothetical protein
MIWARENPYPSQIGGVMLPFMEGRNAKAIARELAVGHTRKPDLPGKYA